MLLLKAFSISLLLNCNFAILRNLRQTLAVADLGLGAQMIPFFELFGALPGSFLMTWGLAGCLGRFSIERVFWMTLSIFLGFFLLYAFWIYPHLTLDSPGRARLFCMLFYTMAELWKPALAVILFFGLLNQRLAHPEAKQLYAPIMLGGGLGSILAGPITLLCTVFSQHWLLSFQLLVFWILLLGILAGFLYHRLWESHSPFYFFPSASLKESMQACLQSQELRLLSWIVIADYIAYSLGEVLFLDVLKLRYPESIDYCRYLGTLSLWSGILTLLSNLFLSPLLFRNHRWLIAALATPLCLLLTEGLFFLAIQGKWLGWTDAQWLGAATLFGSIQYCVCRAAKYSLFDASKELAFILLPDAQRMRGKLIVDGLCARLGRGGASVLSMFLIQMSGGVIASSFCTGWLVMGMACSWILSTFRLGKSIDPREIFHPLR